MKPLVDRFGRIHDYLRFSITPSCNLRCGYCRPERPLPESSRPLLSDVEIVRLARLMVNRLGIRKIRLTGGEPLVRKGIARIMEALAELPAELALTTNGILLKNHFSLLKAVGLHALNISLDSLNAETYRRLTGRSALRTVRDNIEEAITAGFSVKVNTVLIRDVNEAEWPSFVEWTRKAPLQVRFIEFMPFPGNGWRRHRVVPVAEILERVRRRYPVERLTDAPASTSQTYRVPGSAGSFALIGTVTQPFCASCNRLRLLADGRLKDCLFAERETDLLGPLRRDEDLEPRIRRALSDKFPERGGMPSFDYTTLPALQTRTMTATGG